MLSFQPTYASSVPAGPSASSSAVTTVSAPPTTQPMALIRVCAMSTPPGRTPSRRRSVTSSDLVTGWLLRRTSADGIAGPVGRGGQGRSHSR